MKAIIVTGASAGIGRAVAERFLADGWQVGLIARRAELLEEMAEGRANAVILPCDVAEADQVDRAFAEFAAKAGRLDVLFNNAGIFTSAAPIDEVPVEDWMRAVSVNLTGMFLCARAAFGQMRRQSPQGGRIINNGSVSAHVPRPGSVAYTATKHAVTGLTRSLSLDGRPFGIACGQIDIGNAATDMTAGVAAGARQADGSVRPEATFDVAHVGEAVRYMAALPLEANVQFLTLTATTMPWLARG